MDPFVEWKIKRYARVSAEEVQQNLENAVNGVIGPFLPQKAAPRAPKDGLEETPREELKSQKGRSKVEDAASGWESVSYADINKYVKNNSIAFKNTQPQVGEFVRLLTWIMKNDYPDKQIEITNAFRTPMKQITLMRDNWKRNGGNTALEKPYKIEIKGNEYTVATKGTDNLVKVYNDWLGYSIGKELEAGKLDLKKWERHFSKNPLEHGRGKALDFATRGKPWMMEVLVKARKFADTRDPLDEGNHIHIAINSVRKPQVLNSSIDFPLVKSALQITIEPYHSIVMDAAREIEQRQPGYFSEIDKIIIEPGAPSHFGMVKSDEPNTIYVSLDKIKAAMQQENPEQMLAALREVLSHEMGHLKSKFQGGEAPAEAESKRMEQFFNNADQELDMIISVAHELDKKGFKKEADIIDGFINKKAVVTQISNPVELSQTILRILYHFVQKVKPENQRKYIQSLRNRLYTVSPIELAAKNPNPGAGVGASLSIVKNILGGHDQREVADTMQLVFNGLDKF